MRVPRKVSKLGVFRLEGKGGFIVNLNGRKEHELAMLDRETSHLLKFQVAKGVVQYMHPKEYAQMQKTRLAMQGLPKGKIPAGPSHEESQRIINSATRVNANVDTVLRDPSLMRVIQARMRKK